MNRQHVTQSILICPNCGNTFPIMRKSGQQRELFHRKYLYCLICGKKTNHIETKDYDKLLGILTHKDEGCMNAEEKKVYKLIKKRGQVNDS